VYLTARGGEDRALNLIAVLERADLREVRRGEDRTIGFEVRGERFAGT
jgi:hypothetical protein